MASVGILGYGRFGQLLARLLSSDYLVKVYDPHLTPMTDSINTDVIHFVSQETLLKETNLFLTVPINQMEACLQSLAPRLSNQTTVLDTCSVKVYPVKLMQQYLPNTVGIIATHPLFGPDSINLKDHLNFVMYAVRDPHQCYNRWHQFFAKKGFNVMNMTPDKHDRLAAESQGITHFVARTLQLAQLQPTPIDTVGSQQLYQLMEQYSHDSWELFYDLQNYNPYAQAAIERLQRACSQLCSQLHPLKKEDI